MIKLKKSFRYVENKERDVRPLYRNSFSQCVGEFTLICLIVAELPICIHIAINVHKARIILSMIFKKIKLYIYIYIYIYRITITVEQ